MSCKNRKGRNQISHALAAKALKKEIPHTPRDTYIDLAHPNSDLSHWWAPPQSLQRNLRLDSVCVGFSLGPLGLPCSDFGLLLRSRPLTHLRDCLPYAISSHRVGHSTSSESPALSPNNGLRRPKSNQSHHQLTFLANLEFPGGHLRVPRLLSDSGLLLRGA